MPCGRTDRQNNTVDTYRRNLAYGAFPPKGHDGRSAFGQQQKIELMHKLAGLVLGTVVCGCASQTVSVRQRFIPTPDAPHVNWSQLGTLDEMAWQNDKLPVSTDANWTRLGPGPAGEPGDLFLMAHAGIGDTFPVQDENGRTHFVVIVAEGDDHHLLLVVNSKDGAQGFDVWRDTPVSVIVGESYYELLFPTTKVAAAADQTPTIDKAMIIVTHRP